MPSFSRRANQLLSLLVLAALTVSLRLPFLLRADRFFDSDEAVEGLMARHVTHGELPVFLWGQQYKGVPEVYLNAALFSIAGSSVVALKATTLACFVLFVGVQFVLTRALFSTRIAWMTSAILMAGPPSLVLWTMSANAEVVMTFLAGAVMGLALVRFERSCSRGALAVAGAAIGFGLWVHQYILYYVVALGISLMWTRPTVRSRIRELTRGDGLPASLRGMTAVLGAIAVLYFALGLMSFLTGGFDLALGGVFIGLRNPQKLWRIGTALLMLVASVRFVAQLRQPRYRADRSLAVAALVGFLVGYAPALVGNFGSVNLPLARMDAAALRAAAGSIMGEIVPIVVGLRGPSTEWILSPWLGLVLAAVLIASGVRLTAIARGSARQTLAPFFHILLVIVPLAFIASGSFHDSQSYRYMMPVHAALPVALALGVDEMARWHKIAGLAAFASILAMGAVEQTTWYSRLAPDTRSVAIVECLTRHDARGALADYWVSYKVTFLSGERVILAPYNGVDRYPPYAAFVRSLGEGDTDQPCRSLLLQ